MGLRLPVATSLYSVDSTYTDTKHSGQLRNTSTPVEQSTYKDYMTLIEHGASIITTLVCFVFNCVISIFIWCSVTQVRNSVIVPIPIYMTDHHTRWARTNKRFGNYSVDTLRCLGSVFWSFFEGYRQVMRGGVRLPNKPLTIFNGSNPTETANFVPIVAGYGPPKFRSIYHG